MQSAVNIDLGIRDIRQVTNFIKERYGLDYSEYALTSFKRRLEGFITDKRYGIDTLLKNLESTDFLDHFEARIGVGETELFRDPTFWILLKNNFLNNIIKENNKVNIWLPMCASGEEYYSLMILLKESNWTDRCEILVSSFSKESLETVKNGLMEYEKLEISTKNYSRFQGTSLLTNYFKTSGNTVSFEKSLFVHTRFLKDDFSFTNDFGHVNLILFRNKMIYFTPTLQYRVCDAMYNKLTPKGLLALGILEEIDINNQKFTALHKEESIYQRRN
jgi:chemotaxis protein methyltransferase CheR